MKEGDGAGVTLGGSPFHTGEPATGKARSPSVRRWYHNGDACGRSRHWRDRTSATSVNSLYGYSGFWPNGQRWLWCGQWR